MAFDILFKLDANADLVRLSSAVLGCSTATGLLEAGTKQVSYLTTAASPSTDTQETLTAVGQRPEGRGDAESVAAELGWYGRAAHGRSSRPIAAEGVQLLPRLRRVGTGLSWILDKTPRHVQFALSMKRRPGNAAA